MIISPTGKGIRSDRGGDGHYGAGRGNRIHEGVDFECTPGQPVYAPIDGHLQRVARPYADDEKFLGVVIQGAHMKVKMFYMSPDMNKIGSFVNQGDIMGTAQDISEKYGKDVGPHVHMQVDSIDIQLLMG